MNNNKIIFDTNVLLESPEIITQFADRALVPSIVIEELDRFKTDEDLKDQAKAALNYIEQSKAEIIGTKAEGANSDIRIINQALSKYSADDIVIISYDTGMRLHAKARSVTALTPEDFLSSEKASENKDNIPYLTVSLDEARNFIYSLPVGEYNITLTGKSDREKLDDLIKYSFNYNKKKIHLDLSLLHSLKFITKFPWYWTESYEKWDEEKSGIVSICLPKNISSIGNCAFLHFPKLKKISIPKSLKVIGDDAFTGCSSLEELSYEGSLEEWKKIHKGKNWSNGIPALSVKCTDGEEKIETLYLKKLASDGEEFDINDTRKYLYTYDNAGKQDHSDYKYCLEICSDSVILAGIHPLAKSVTIPKECDVIFCDFSKTSVNEIKVEEGNKTFCVKNGAIYHKDEEGLALTHILPNTESITIAKECKDIRLDLSKTSIKEVKLENGNETFVIKDGFLCHKNGSIVSRVWWS